MFAEPLRQVRSLKLFYLFISPVNVSMIVGLQTHVLWHPTYTHSHQMGETRLTRHVTSGAECVLRSFDGTTRSRLE